MLQTPQPVLKPAPYGVTSSESHVLMVNLSCQLVLKLEREILGERTVSFGLLVGLSVGHFLDCYLTLEVQPSG